MANQPEITRAFNERQKYRDRIIAFSLSIQTARAQFSDGDDWTQTDDCWPTRLTSCRKPLTSGRPTHPRRHGSPDGLGCLGDKVGS